MAHRWYRVAFGALIVLVALMAFAPVIGAAARQEETASLDVGDQPIKDGTVVMQEINVLQDGWVAVHEDIGGKPGKTIGFTALKKGEVYKVAVKLSQSVAAGSKLWAMLHIDAGKIGVYEFPGADSPVVVNNDIVMKSFAVTGSEGAPASGQAGESGNEETPSLDLDDQALSGGAVTVTEANMTQDGWMAVHEDVGGNPGKTIGFTALKKGETYTVVVKLNQDVPAGGKVWAMLHIDAGKIGVYEFPGADSPVVVNNDIMMKPITIKAAGAGNAQTPSTLPVTGDSSGGMAALIAAALALLAGGLLLRGRRAPKL